MYNPKPDIQGRLFYIQISSNGLINRTSVFLSGPCCSCTCRNRCLGPLTFHPEFKGQRVELSAGDCRATRNLLTFRHGVTFSSRPIQINEKVHLCVERCVKAWHGALRIGFTTVPPCSTPIFSLAIPDLTIRPGFWATPVPENLCFPGTKLTFWVTSGGYLRFQIGDLYERAEKMSQINTSKPIWAMIDLYGQTSTVCLLGSEKKFFCGKRRSCSAPIIGATEMNIGYDQVPEEMLWKRTISKIPDFIPPTVSDNEELCVVCYSKTASIVLKCGHSCLCPQCAVRIINDFGTCPLCRQYI
ncbi:E3 ubiquitin-protein ligase NEURL3 [Silurus asotus]|uniref:E3 ubiquitin-protein ligase NEURL3 n=1 Tax=Silurus asotus TaxID=30991 RepID=A0AAD5FNI9_SILAS|nr:E3 ubiquitin-protein ligase NEURL3 [Silurus asotus]